MNTLVDLLQQPLVHRLGWTLLHFLWQGAMLAAAYAAVRGLVHRRSANTRYLAGCLTLLLMAAAPVLTFRALDAKPAVHHAAPVVTAPAPTLPAMAPPADAGPSFDGWAKLAGWLNKVTEATLPWFVGVWAVGVFALSLRLGVGWFQVQRLRRRSVEPLDEWLGERLADLQRRLRVSRPVRLVKSALVEVPTVIGWLRPVILLPASTLSGLSPLQLELILAHELAHLRRGDYWVNLFQILLETLLFYHPAVWWVSRCVREDRELCCDDLAVAVCGNRLAYAQALTALEELRQPPANVALAASGGSLMARVKHILGLPTETTPSAGRRVAGGALIALGLLAIAASVVMMLAPDRYCSVARISVGNGTQETNAPRADFDPYFMATEAERIQSTLVLYPVIKKFDLQKKWAARYNGGEELSEQQAFQLFLRNLEVHQERNSKLIDICVFDEDRDEATDLANAIVGSYRLSGVIERQAMSQRGIDALQPQLSKQTLVVSNLQAKVDDLRVKLGIIDADEVSVSAQSALKEQRIAAMVQQFTQAQQLEQAKSQYVLYKTKLTELMSLDHESMRQAVLTVVPEERVLPQRLDELSAVEQKLAQLKIDYGPNSQDVKRAEAWQRQVEKQIEDRLKGILKGLEDNVTAYKAQVENIKQDMAELRVQASEESVKQQSYYTAKHDLETQQKICDALMLRARQEQVDASVPVQSLVEVVDRAEPGLRAVSPNRYLAGALGMSGLLFVFAGISLRRAPQPAPAKA